MGRLKGGLRLIVPADGAGQGWLQVLMVLTVLTVLTVLAMLTVLAVLGGGRLVM
jgi:hypothetical protein